MYKKITIFFLLVLSYFSGLYPEQKWKVPPYDYYVTICSIFNNDAPWLKEWIEYHKLIGVDHFILYNNESVDNYKEVLYPYIISGDVTLIDWPNRPEEEGICAWVKATQQSAYNNALETMQRRTFWLAFIDTDEFILPLTETSLAQFLRNYEKYGALAINWVSYGTSNYEEIPADKLMIECLTRRAPYINPHFMGEKSIVRPDYVECCNDPHLFPLINNMKTIDSNWKPYVKSSTTNFNKIVINHYFTRTLNFLFNYKIPRKLRMDNIPISEERLSIMMREANVEEDFTIRKFVDQLRKNMEYKK